MFAHHLQIAQCVNLHTIECAVLMQTILLEKVNKCTMECWQKLTNE